MKTVFKGIVVFLTVIGLLLTSGCQSEESKLKKLQEKTEQLINDGKFEEAVEACDNAISSGMTLETVKPVIEDVYTNWAMSSITTTSINPALQVIDGMIEKYPDLKESGENIIVDMGNWALESYGDDVEGMRRVYDAFIEIYYESDIICNSIDSKMKELTTGFMNSKLDELISKGLLTLLDNDEIDAVYDLIDEFRLYSYKMAVNYHFIFPYVKNLDNGKSIKIEYVHSFFTMYYGELDSQGNRTGEAVQLVYAVNMKEQEKYAKVYLRGQFSDDMVNGEFSEYSYKIVKEEIIAHTSGKMVDNKYDGEISSIYETDTSKDNYIFMFVEGMVQKLGRMVDVPGEYYAVAVDNTTDPGNPWYYAYTKEGLEKERGFYPYYSMLY
ncbi:MAG: hypothetical protein IJ115_03220 [Erysipelotrichaceae bacterium]|nr:hypothetical protein [Erysipelotrichaceae bacterium]